MNPGSEDAGFPAWGRTLCREQSLPEQYLEDAGRHLPALARRISGMCGDAGRPQLIGIAGAQGSGKSTLALFLNTWLRREEGLSCVTLSLDDLYLEQEQRRELARRVHPLLATRGVPGTHDVALAQALLDDMTQGSARHSIRLPVFDKARDDRVPAAEWKTAEAPVDVVLFEGWCIGARPQPEAALQMPVNDLEAAEDADGRWRRYVNHRLATDYASLFGRLDALVMLRVPSFELVLEWRLLQEHKLRERKSKETAEPESPEGQTDAQIARFIMHFERLTRHMQKTMPVYADSLIDVDDRHRLAARTDRGWPRGAGS